MPSPIVPDQPRRAWPVGVVPVPVPAAVLPHDTRLFLWSQDGLQPLPPAMDTVDSPEASMPPEPSVPAPPSPPPSLPMPAHRDAAHAENYIGRTQFDVPWSVWGGEYLDSTRVIVGTLTRYKNGRFTLTFPVSENTKPEYLLWAHVLGEVPWRGHTLQPRAEPFIDLEVQARAAAADIARAAGASHGAGLAVGARRFIDRTPRKARARPLPQPFRLLADVIGRVADRWIGNAVPSNAVVDASTILPDGPQFETFRMLQREDTITCWTKAEIDHPIHFFEQIVQCERCGAQRFHTTTNTKCCRGGELLQHMTRTST